MQDLKIDVHTTPVLRSVGEQVLQIVGDNVSSLSLTHPPAGHPKFSAYRASLILEVSEYLATKPPHRMELVTASQGEKVIGFTLCGLPISGATNECGIYYTATAKPFRHKGVMRLMMQSLISRYPTIALSCDVALVPIYEKFGFRCVSLREHQIVMSLGQPVEEIPVLDVAQLLSHPSVMVERQNAEDSFSSHEIACADRDLAKRLKADKQKAKRFLEGRTYS